MMMMKMCALSVCQRWSTRLTCSILILLSHTPAHEDYEEQAATVNTRHTRIASAHGIHVGQFVQFVGMQHPYQQMAREKPPRKKKEAVTCIIMTPLDDSAEESAEVSWQQRSSRGLCGSWPCLLLTSHTAARLTMQLTYINCIIDYGNNAIPTTILCRTTFVRRGRQISC